MQNLLRKLLAVWIFQLVFCFTILVYVLFDKEKDFTVVPNARMSFCMFIAAMLMQMTINDEVSNGLKMMKYVINH